MKKITLFLLTILISCSAWASITGGDYFFFSPGVWNVDNAKYSVYFWNSSGNTGLLELKKWGKTNYYYCTPKEGTWTSAKFLRKDPNSSSTDWTSWNDTGDLNNITGNCFSINGWSYGSWSKYTPILYVAGFDNWSETAYKMESSSVNVNKHTYTFYNQKPSTKEFKITNGTWDWQINENGNNFKQSFDKVVYAFKITATLNSQSIDTEITYVDYNNLYISSNLLNGELKLTNTKEHSFTADVCNVQAGKHTITITDKTTGWYITKDVTLSTDATKLTINADINSENIEFSNVISPIFDNSTNLALGTYGKLSYQLEMPDDRWYWIVLPYDVNVSEITTTGTGTNGDYNDLVFTEYDAQTRAGGGNGWINWKTAGKDIAAETLTANKGYVIGPKTTAENGGDKFPGWTITFPSASATNTVAGEAIDLKTTNTGGTTINDNWNIIGTGLYHEGSLSDDINYVAIPDNDGDYNYYYISSPIDDLKQLTSFAPFEAFFVQYGGTYSAKATDAQSAALAPVARAKAQEQEQIYLINMNEAHTVVILNAEGSEGYTAGEDFLEMNIGSRIEMIYSFDAEDALAFNHRATEAQSIALGGYVAVAGEQTISLDAYNGNAEAVTLIDNVTGTTTDLLAEDYTFTAEVGSLDGRFTIVFAAQKAGSDTTVDCYNSIANQVIAYGTADHCTVSGLTAGEAIVVYNTMGQLVFATTADSETITLPSLTAGNYLILHNGTTNKVTLK